MRGRIWREGINKVTSLFQRKNFKKVMLKVLSTSKDEVIKDSKLILSDAMDEGFETVLVVGIKDNQVYFRCSGCLNIHEKLGLIEAAKLDWLSSWE